MFPVKFTDDQSLQALDPNAKMIAYAGHGVVSGCDVSINTGALGSSEATVTVASGTLLVGGSTSDKTSADVALEDADPNHPRKDLVVFDPSIPGFTAISGVAEEADPIGAIRQDAERPAPPSLSSSVDAISGSGDPVIPLAEAWIPAGASGITSDDLADRRQEVSPEVSSIEIDDKADIPVYSDDTSAPNETLYFNSDKSQTKYKDSSGVVYSPTRTTLFMSDYVAATDRDGSVAVDSEFDAAIADAEPHDTIVFDDGTYQLASSHTITKSLTVTTSDADIEYTNTANNNAAILFKGDGLGGSASLDATASKGDRTLSVGSVSPYSAGDYVLVIDGTYSETVNAPMQFQQIESVDSTNLNITLFGGLRQEFPASSTDVHQVSLLDSPTMDGLETSGGGIRHLQFRWCHEPEFQDCRVSEYTEVSLYSLDCWKPRYRDCEAYDPNGLASGEGEPIALYRCSDGYIESPRIEDCRRGIDFAWGSHNCTVIDPVIRGVSLNGISVHQDDQSGVITISGGEIVCDPNGQSGAGITSSTTAQLYVDGTRIVARENGVICSGETHVSNVTVETTEGVSAPQIAAFNIKHGDTTIRDCFIDDREGYYDFPVWIDGAGTAMEHISVDVETAHPGPNHVYLDARDGPLSDIKVTGMLRNMDGTADQAIFVRADTSNIIENVDISVTAKDLPNQGVRVLSGGTEQITNLTFHDCYFTTGLAAIYTDGTGSFGSIRVSDCNCDTGSTSLSFNETVNKLFITNNDISGSIDATGATNSTVTGNL